MGYKVMVRTLRGWKSADEVDTIEEAEAVRNSMVTFDDVLEARIELEDKND